MATMHSVLVKEQATSVSTPVQAKTGIPFVVGIAPIQAADDPATVGVPVLCTSWNEAVEKLGYNDNWSTFTLCEFMYSHFVLYGLEPVIFLNLYDPTTMNDAVASASISVIDHKINLGELAINDAGLVVKKSSTTLVKDTDYSVYYTDGELIIELLSGSSAYNETSLNVGYNKAVVTSINASAVAAAMEKIELCMSMFGLVPDLICAPGFSDNATVAATMATKAANITGLFRAKAIVDIPSDSTNGATTAAAVPTKKTALNMNDENMIACWPMCAKGEKVYHMSTQVAGVLAATDTENGAPYASPSNHDIRIDRLCTAAGATVLLALAQANALNNAGVVTGLNFLGSFKLWGNYTACYPENEDVKDYYISISRMFDWVANSIICTFWSQLDKPMTRRLIDTILDTVNIWMNGLTGSGYILGGRVEMINAENTLSNLMAGILKFHVYMTPPSPAQELDFVLEYDPSYVEAALNVD